MDQLALFVVPASCSVDGCSRSIRVKRLRLCSPHYIRGRRYGDPLAGGPERPRVRAAKPVVDLADGRRVCGKCGEAKPLDEFPRDRTGTKGRRANCKPCHTAGAMAWYEDNRDEHLARIRKRRQTDGGRARALDRARYERDKPKRIALVVEAGHRRRALMRQVPSERGITVVALRKRHGDHCCYCRVTMTFESCNGRAFVPLRATIEHLTPLALGGHHTWDNVALACWQCNVRKNATPLDEWLANTQVGDASPS